jgi:hypothetical protein
MDAVLIILGVLGFGAILISAYVFVVAARNYVSDDYTALRETRVTPTGRPYILRSATDRRSGKPVEFPLTVNGVVIPEDRRRLPDRRSSMKAA